MTISSVALECLDAAREGWRSTGLSPPAASRVVVGPWSMEACCDGVLVLSVDSLAWYDPFPFDAFARGSTSGRSPMIPFMGAGSASCAGTFGALASLWIGLCVPGLNDRGEPPPPADETAAMLLLGDLVQAIAVGLVCPEPETWAVGAADFASSEGGCLLGHVALRLDGS